MWLCDEKIFVLSSPPSMSLCVTWMVGWTKQRFPHHKVTWMVG
jgi:hypothetical protein